MNAFLASAIRAETSNEGIRIPLVNWIKARLEARRRRQRERLAIARLRQLEPYLLADAGIDPHGLHSGFARIMAVHNKLLMPDDR